MMQKLRACCVPCCKREKQELVHKFPADNDRAAQWVKILNVADFDGLPIDNIRKRFFVCTRHFRDSDYKNKASRCINITAVPSLNLKDLTDAEGLQRVIPPHVRPEMGHSSITTIAADAATVTTIDTLSKEAMESGSDKKNAASAPHERLHEFIEDPFSTETSLLASAPDPVAKVSQPLLQTAQRTLPNTTKVWRSIRRQSPTDPPLAKVPKLVPQPLTKPKEPIVLQRVKMLPTMAVRRKSVANSKMTQTELEDDQQQQHQTADKQSEQNEGDRQSATTSTTTKVLALLECTPENLQRLRRKLEEQDGILALNDRLWQTMDDGTEDDKG